ncbi:MAG: ComF family protein [Candidatus Portnoybacteria bacterium]
MSNITTMKKFLLDLIFPITCLDCQKPGEFICPSCLDRISLNQELPKERLIITTDYKNPLVKEAVHQFKYNFVQDLSYPFGKLMSRKLSSYFSNNSTSLIPVPLHQKRLKWRGFNQSELLAQQVSQNLNIPVINNILLRSKHAPPQVKIENAKERERNIKNAFELNPNFNQNLENKTIILVDDISTTGATLKECAETLEPLKPKHIWKLVLAKG